MVVINNETLGADMLSGVLFFVEKNRNYGIIIGNIDSS